MARLSRIALVLALVASILSVTAPARAEQASSQVRSFQGGLLDGGEQGHMCAVLEDASVRCWGWGIAGVLGYGSTDPVEVPAAAGPVDLGPGRTALAVAVGGAHTCALLDDHTVRCWGSNSEGQTGLGSTATIGDDETPAAVAPVDLGPGRTALAIGAGFAHTCALLDDRTVRCWGLGSVGQLGYGNTTTIGDDETPAAAGPVDLGPGRTAIALSVGPNHNCAILDTGALLCWGWGIDGQLGYGNLANLGDNETPGSVGPVPLGAVRVIAVNANQQGSCAILDDRTLRCWGAGQNGRLGYGNTAKIGDDEPASAAGPIELGPGRTAVALAGGFDHACALLDDGTVRCWGSGANGQHGQGNMNTIGDDETPAAVAPVNLGAGRTAVAITAGVENTCVLLDTGSVRCWGVGPIGYPGSPTIGDDETPGSVAPISLGGRMTAQVADLSVSVTATAASVAGGGDAGFTVTVRNDGPDAAQAPQLLVSGPGASLVSGTPSAGSFDAARGIWQPGPLASGASATLALVERPTAAGSLVVSAEVVVAPTRDPDSSPANFRATEDDQASAATTVLAPPPSLPPAPPSVPKATADRLTLTLAPATDTSAPHVFAATGRLVVTRAALATACTGSVTLTAKAGTRTLASKTAALKLKDGACEYAGKLTVTAKARKTAKTAKVTAAFAGNDALRPIASRPARATLA